MHLEEMKNEIETLVLEKGFYNRREDIPKKLLFAFIELGEASDAWKKGKNEEKIAEELVDVIFYVLDASRLACPSINMDAMFKKKLEKNKNREYQYGEGHRTKENIQQKTRDSSRSALIEAFSRDRNFRIGLKSQRPHGRRLVRERNKHID